MRDIAVIGLGRAGLPLACIIADSGYHVVGLDVDEDRCKRFINVGKNPIPEEPGLDELLEKHGGKNLIATSNYDDCQNCETFIVIAPLTIDKHANIDFSVLESIFINIGNILKSGDLVVLETTVPPMTTETVIREWLERQSGLRLGEFYLAYSPERIMTGYSVSRLQEFPKIIGGVDETSGETALSVYRKFIPNIRLVSSARIAEFTKVIEGCYRDVNIALANELFKIAEELEIDFYEARENANHEYCQIHLPSTGVGGHCIPVYPRFLIREMEKRDKLSHSQLLKSARLINDEMASYWANRIVLECRRIDKPLNEVQICLQGISFRKGVKELFHSRNMLIATLLMAQGLNVFVYDELFTANEVEEIGLNWIEPREADLIFDCYGLTTTSQSSNNIVEILE